MTESSPWPTVYAGPFLSCPRCARIHRRWNSLASCLFGGRGRVGWIIGGSHWSHEWVVATFCREHEPAGVMLSLHGSRDEAALAAHRLDDQGCGPLCLGPEHHTMGNLRSPKPEWSRRLNIRIPPLHGH